MAMHFCPEHGHYESSTTAATCPQPTHTYDSRGHPIRRTPESPAPQSAGLSEREECPLCEHAWRRHDPEDGRCDAGPPCECGRSIGWMRERIATLARLALADEKGATAARPAEHEGASPSDTSGWTREVAVAMWRQEHAAKLRILATLAERERELRDVGNALTRQALDVDALKKKLAAAERVVEAARARLEVWTRETYVGVRDALKGYDALSRS